MKLFQRLFFAAVLAGLAAGIAMSAVQQWKVAPLILEAEVYEDAEAAAAAPAHDATAMAAMGHELEAEDWKPDNGGQRIGLTVLADLLAAVGFALVLGAVATVSGLEITARNGVVWGLCGFLVFHLAPAFGLPPELPGMPAADLFSRQVWWWGTVLATGAAFLGIARFRNWTAVGIGAVLILLPHIIGAPPIPDDASSVPAHLATSFAASALSVAAVFWLTLGPLYGYLFARFASAEAPQPRPVHA